MPITGHPWVNYLDVKRRLCGLMPLQELVYQNYRYEYSNDNKDSSNTEITVSGPQEKSINELTYDPFYTYLLFLAYENEVTAQINAVRREALKKWSANENDGRGETATDFVQNEERKAFCKIRDVLYNPNAKNNLAHHNISLKMGLHVFGLLVVSVLMVGISGSNTANLLNFLDDNDIVEFGPYGNLSKAFFYTSSMWAQWMMYRKNVPRTIKGVCRSNGSFDYFETKNLAITEDPFSPKDDFDKNYVLRFKSSIIDLGYNEEYKRDLEAGIEKCEGKKIKIVVRHKPDGNSDDSPRQSVSPNSSQTTVISEYEYNLNDLDFSRFRYFYLNTLTMLTCLLGFSFGMMVLDKQGKLLTDSDGFFDLDNGDALALAATFGIAAFLATVLLWTSGLRDQVKEEERVALKEMILKRIANENKSENLSAWEKTKKLARSCVPTSTRETGILLVVFIGLLSAVLSQVKVTFAVGDAWGKGEPFADSDYDPLALSMLVGALFLTAVALVPWGRKVFTARAMNKVVNTLSKTWDALTWNNLQQEYKNHATNYQVGAVLSIGVLTVFILSLGISGLFSGIDELNAPLLSQDGEDPSKGWLTPMGITVLSAVVLWGVFSATPWSKPKPDLEEKPWLKLKEGSESRSGQQLIALLVNAISYGTMGGLGVGYGAEACGIEEGSTVYLILVILASLATAATSASTAMNSVEIDYSDTVVSKSRENSNSKNSHGLASGSCSSENDVNTLQNKNDETKPKHEIILTGSNEPLQAVRSYSSIGGSVSWTNSPMLNIGYSPAGSSAAGTQAGTPVASGVSKPLASNYSNDGVSADDINEIVCWQSPRQSPDLSAISLPPNPPDANSSTLTP